MTELANLKLEENIKQDHLKTAPNENTALKNAIRQQQQNGYTSLENLQQQQNGGYTSFDAIQQNGYTALDVRNTPQQNTAATTGYTSFQSTLRDQTPPPLNKIENNKVAVKNESPYVSVEQVNNAAAFREKVKNNVNNTKTNCGSGNIIQS